ncbi:hypothetical protein C1646_666338 [Rhizophagus diaphanus]|nr:hypothetical protein C1646_666338 [Rhizophagus diaphanus] [Rhizophagus sp. MUCL 43196]
MVVLLISLIYCVLKSTQTNIMSRNIPIRIYNVNVPSLLDSDEESDSHEEDFIIKSFLLIEEGIKAHNEEKYDIAWECLVAQSEIENLKAKYWKTYCYLYNGINVSKNLVEEIKLYKEAAEWSINNIKIMNNI